MEPGRAQDRSVERRPTVLVVDDQPDVAETAAEILIHSGYDVKLAHTAVAALDMLDRGEAIDVLFLDIGLRGGMSGLDLALICRDRFPAVAALLTSGHGDALGEAEAKGFQVLPKPYFVASLQAALARLAKARP